MSSCANGHPISPGAESCAVCGDDVRPRCYQGHHSAAGSRFCETCGAMLAVEPAAAAADLPAADLVTEYTSRPFNEFLVEDAGHTGDDGAPPRPDAAAATSSGSAAAPASESAAAAPPGSAAAPASAANGRPRSRTLTAALGVAVLTAAGVAGGLTLHQRTGQQAQAGPSLGRTPTVPPTAPAPIAPTAPASALPASSPMPTLTVVPPRWTAPAPIEQWAGWIGRRDQYRGLPAAEHDPLGSRQPQQSGDRWPGRAEWPGARWGVPPDRGGSDGGSQQWQHDGGYQR